MVLHIHDSQLAMKPRNPFTSFFDFLNHKVKEGVVTESEWEFVVGVHMASVAAAGGTLPDEVTGLPAAWSPGDESLLPVARHAVFLMKKKLLELHPEFEQELSNLDGPVSARE